MPNLSNKEIEAIADRVLRAYWKLPAASQFPERVVPYLLARGVLGLKVDFQHLSDSGTILGLTSFGECEALLPDPCRVSPYHLDGKTILVESDLQLDYSCRGQMNFTVMHECSHHIIKLLYPREYQGMKCRLCYVGSGVYDREEHMMDQLASMLLMPRDLVLKNLHAFGLPDGIPLLNPNLRARDYHKFCQVADRMGVSLSALRIRMRQLKLLGKVEMINPNARIEFWREAEEDG